MVFFYLDILKSVNWWVCKFLSAWFCLDLDIKISKLVSKLRVNFFFLWLKWMRQLRKCQSIPNPTKANQFSRDPDINVVCCILISIECAKVSSFSFECAVHLQAPLCVNVKSDLSLRYRLRRILLAHLPKENQFSSEPDINVVWFLLSRCFYWISRLLVALCTSKLLSV